MFTFRSCCDASGRSPRYSAWIIGVSLGASLIAVGVQLAVGASVYAQTLLYAAFPLALLAAEELSRTGRRSPLVRGAGLILKLAAAYGFFLAVTILADLI
jgi:hypothetical protein